MLTTAVTMKKSPPMISLACKRFALWRGAGIENKKDNSGLKNIPQKRNIGMNNIPACCIKPIINLIPCKFTI